MKGPVTRYFIRGLVLKILLLHFTAKTKSQFDTNLKKKKPTELDRNFYERCSRNKSMEKVEINRGGCINHASLNSIKQISEQSE